MILRLFKTSQPLSWLIFIGLVLILRIIGFVFLAPASTTDIATLSQWDFLAHLASQLPWVSHLLASFTIILSAIIYNSVAHTIQLVTDQNTYMALIFATVLSLFPSNLWLNPFLISLPALIFSIGILGKQPKNTLYLKSTFNSALLAGVAAVIFPPNGTFLIVSLIILTILFPAKWRHYALSIIGFYTAPFFVSSIQYLLDITPSVDALFNTTHLINYARINVIIPISVVGLALISLPSFFKGYAHKAVRTRKLYNIHLIWFTINVGGFLLFYDYNQSILGYIAFPLSVIMVSGQQATKKWWVSDFYMLLLFGVLGYNYYLIASQLITP